ncbi:hypothetical protein DOM21_13355 [Bacteriovorax stolpii]|uniref:Uncharacterized protein n=1 Tax=Bacteriovorax stolpii TaxID=960 RepID=A0A2K9NQ33_BACTC|nr:hypothetical protein [Bacteriovorax stolpii]AUN97613.1 hypothetical protein C0V70_05690 [Bacteriovorax stolpii]QDK42414.1 hypothetical protein DOM21_13355 [Bacteriovorax stolpii]
MKTFILLISFYIIETPAMEPGKSGPWQSVCITYPDGKGACYFDVSKETVAQLKKQESEMFQAKIKEAEENAKALEAVQKFKQAQEDEYIKQASESAMNMLAEATAKYKAGQITKEQFLEISLQAGQMASYKNQGRCLNMGLTGTGCTPKN